MERKSLFRLLFLALAGLASPARAGGLEPALLLLDHPITRSIEAEEVQVYRLPLHAGDYARIEIGQKGVDVETLLRDPEGVNLATFDSHTGAYSIETASLVAARTGDHWIEVTPLHKGPGRYQIRLAEIHSAGPADRQRVEAERADLMADGFVMRGGPDGIRAGKQALDLWRALGDRVGEAQALTRLGMILDASGQPAEALAFCEEALTILRPLGEKAGMAESLNQIGKSSRRLGFGRRAVTAHKEAIALWRELAQSDRIAKALLSAGKTHEQYGEPDEALTAYQEALDLNRKTGDRGQEAAVLNSLGFLHARLGEPQEALGELQAALGLAQESGRSLIEADVHANLGDLYKRLGMLREALEHQVAALEIARAAGDREQLCGALAQLGNLLFQLGSPKDAEGKLLEALPLCTSSRNRALALDSLGRVADQLGRSTEAAARLEAALALQKQLSDYAGEAETLRTQGLLFLKAGQPARAKEKLGEAIELFEQHGLKATAVSARRAFAQAQSDLDEIEDARKSFEEAKRQAESLDDLGEQALILAGEGRLEQKAGRLTVARARLESALSLAETIRAEIGGDRFRAQHFATVREIYDNYVDVLMQLSQTDPEAGLLSVAFEAAERSRARSLLDVLTRARIENLGGDPELRRRELLLRQELNAKASASRDLPEGTRRDLLQRDIQTLASEHRVLEARLADRSGLSKEGVSLAQTQALLDEDTAVLEYLLGEPRSYVWVVTKTTISGYNLPGRREIEGIARQAHEALSNPSERDARTQRQILQLCARELLEKALDGLTGRRLLIVADGALQYVPFGALPLPAPSSLQQEAAQPLLAQYEILLLPSVAVLKEIRRVADARPPSPLSIAILADPQYAESAPAPRPKSDGTERSRTLEELPWSRREAEQIGAVAQGRDVLLALGTEASRQLVTSDRLSRYRILHFATHGFLDSEHPEFSGLALAQYDGDGRRVDGFVFLQDLYSLHLQADLAVLSGCETGLGHDLRGEGFLGLTHGFLHAGASQVVASLWPVRDRAAAELMQRFYRAMLEEGMHPAAALRNAQLELRSQRAWRDPYFWAAFVIQGDWLAGAFEARQIPDVADRADTVPGL